MVKCFNIRKNIGKPIYRSISTVNLWCALQSLAEQELHLKTQIKDLEANVIAAAPDKAKQKQMEKNLEVYSKGVFVRLMCVGLCATLDCLFFMKTLRRRPLKRERWRQR